MNESAGVVAHDDEVAGNVAPVTHKARLIRVTSRLGVWGLVGGLTPVIAAAFDVVVPLSVAIPLMGVGLLVSGAGTALSSWFVLKSLKGHRSPLRSAAIAGLPLGGAIAVYGLTTLLQWSPLVRALGTITPAAIVLGALVVVFLIISFFLNWREGD